MVKKKHGQTETMIYKTIKLKTEQYEPHNKPAVNSFAANGYSVDATLVRPSCYPCYKSGEKS